MWWSTTTLFIKPKRLTSGSRSIPDLSCCGCRRIVPEPIRLNGPLGMCTTSAPAIISASAYAIWSRMSSIICRLMGPGTIKSLGFTMSPKSPSRSTVWSLSNSHESPPECTNLVWSGLASYYRRGAGEHRDYLIGCLHIGKEAGHSLELRLMRGAVDLGHRILDQDHPIIMLDPAAYSCRHADARGDTSDHAGGHAHGAEDGVERRVREPPEAFLDDQVLAGPGLQRVDDLRPPGA